MHSFSCFFLLHHHFEALTTSTDSISISSSSIREDTMSYESDNEDGQSNIEDEQSNIDMQMEIPQNEIIESEPDHPRGGSTINPVDDDSQFIYDDDSNRLICIGTTFDDIPQSIIDAYSLKTKILDLSKNRFRSIDCINNFPNLEELILDENVLDDTHTNFPKLSNLQTLMLNKNRFQDVYKLVDQLRHAYPALTHLSLLGNEACPYRIIPTNGASSNNTDFSSYAQSRLEEEYQRYRHVLIFRIPTLKFLDASEISPNERRIAEHLGDILYTIAETKQSQLFNEEKKNDKKDNYTPLPTTTNNYKQRVAVGTVRHKYGGEGSQGNKFVQDVDL